MLKANLEELTGTSDTIFKVIVLINKDILKENPIEDLFDRETDEMMIRNSYRSEGLKEGEKRGEKRGTEKTKLELAKSFKDKGVDVNTISDVTGLSLKKIMLLWFLVTIIVL